VLAEGIQQVQLMARSKQGLVLMLAMDLDQSSAELRKLGQGRRSPLIQAREPPSAGLPRAAAAAPSSVRFQPARRGLRRHREVEFGGQFGALGAVADHPGVGTVTVRTE